MVAVEQVLTASAVALSALCSTTTTLPADAVVALGPGLEPVTLQYPATFTIPIPCPTVTAVGEEKEEDDPVREVLRRKRNVTGDPEPAPTVLPAIPPIIPPIVPPVVLPGGGETRLSTNGGGLRYSDFRDPFYASTFPICYALAATTITAYILVVMLLVTPRSFLDGGVVRLNRRSFTNSSSQGWISIGGRPILQKLAAITVAASLTLASSSTFNIAEKQYQWGAQNAKVLQDEVLNGTEMKVIRLISDTFLWLAQAQTLIRVFPRQREKVIIKWAAFFLITLDVIFSGVNSFVYTSNGVNGRAPSSTNQGGKGTPSHSIPALSYIFQLALGALYALWIIYYAIMKRRYAFYHPLMKNICLVAVISIVSIFIPIIFFVIDISKPKFTAWGDYVRWVGAAAAAVVVWEWVERIEALEREEKKDDILGREVFDGDDVLEINASEYPKAWEKIRRSDSSWSDEETRDLYNSRRGGDSGGGVSNTAVATTNTTAAAAATARGDRPGRPPGSSWPGLSRAARRRKGNNQDRSGNDGNEPSSNIMSILRPPLWPTRPPPVAAPTVRTDTPSAASTVYAVRYQTSSDAAARTPEPRGPAQNQPRHLRPPLSTMHQTGASLSPPTTAWRSADNETGNGSEEPLTGRRIQPTSPVSSLSSSFRGPSDERPTSDGSRSRSRRPSRQAATPVKLMTTSPEDKSGWDFKLRFQDFAATQADKIREKFKPTTDTASLPVTIIPAPARHGSALQQVLDEEQEAARTGTGTTTTTGTSSRGRQGAAEGRGFRRGRNARDMATLSSVAARRGPGSREDTFAEQDLAERGLERYRGEAGEDEAGRGEEDDFFGLRPEQPPLWPGVQSRFVDNDDEDEYYYDEDDMEEEEDEEGIHRSSSSSTGDLADVIVHVR